MRPIADRGVCRGPSRRSFLKVGMLGAWGLAIDDLFRLRARAESTGGPIARRADACILVWLAGGASHLDTWDPKPDAPAEVRGEFEAIDTAVPGLRLGEVLPRMAATMGRATLVRTITSPEFDHEAASHHLMTGYRPSPALVYPSFGSVVARVRSEEAGTLPPYVALPDAPLYASSGYLTPAFDPFAIDADPSQPGFRVRHLTPPDRLTLERLRRRRSMVEALDAFATDVGSSPLTTSRDAFTDRAYDLLTSADAQSAFRVMDEPDAVRDRYGRTTLGQSCLLARRLVEAGVPFVTVNNRGAGPLGWDTHAQNFPTIRDTLAPPLDQGLSALLDDLADRGLLDRTLVIVMGEFGRTPRINGNAGRDHHGRASSVLLAGGGMPGGAVIGQTDPQGDSPTDRPVTPADLAATLFTALGINPSQQLETPDGQPIRLVTGGQALPELVGA